MKYFIKILYFSLLTFTSVQAQDTLSNKVTSIELKTSTGTIYGTLVTPSSSKRKDSCSINYSRFGSNRQRWK